MQSCKARTKDQSTDVDRHGSRRDGALEVTREATDTYRELAKSRPDAFLPDLAGSLNNLGNRLADGGDRAGALEATREAVDIRRALVASNPGNAQSQRDLSVALTDLALAEEEVARLNAALQHARESLVIDERLVELDPTDATWQGAVAASRGLVERLRTARE